MAVCLNAQLTDVVNKCLHLQGVWFHRVSDIDNLSSKMSV